MIKRPITSTGELRYFELIKISFLLAFLFAVMAKYIGQVDVSGVVVTGSLWVIMALYLVQLGVLCTDGWLELWELLESYVIEVRNVPRTPMTKTPVVVAYHWVVPSISKSYLRNSVIRC